MTEPDLNRRKVLKTIGAGAIGGAVLPGSATAHNPGRTATAMLTENNDSGVSGDLTIEEDSDGFDNLEVSGTAEGLDPNKNYISLFYDVESEPDGPTACEPGVHNPEDDDFLTSGQMQAADWNVDSDGDGTAVDIDNEHVHLDEIGTVSIRDESIGFGPKAVVACGEVIIQ